MPVIAPPTLLLAALLSHPLPAADDVGSPVAPVAPGDWSESHLYKFRLERIEPCGAGPAARFRGEITWIGAFFTVEAKDPALYVSARDLELRRGGVILPAAFANPPKLPGCRPVAAAKRLRAGERVSGFALFEVPKAFRTRTPDPIVLSYRPTRWGGARRADVPIPECFDACTKPWVGKGPRRALRNDR
jgi:hypothetical protein